MDKLKRILTEENNRGLPIMIWMFLIICFFFNFHNTLRYNYIFLVLLNSVFLINKGTYQYAKISCCLLILIIAICMMIFY